MTNELREKLAELEHEQWMKWAQALLDDEIISPFRRKRWEKYMVPYVKLDEKTKDYDRKWADKVLNILGDHKWT